MLKAVQAVQAVLDKKWIPEGEFPPSTTFFSIMDRWQYNAIMDTRVCELCRQYEDFGEFNGAMLRTFFPYLEIVDVGLILAHVHPNCRCYLERVMEKEE